jgi:hypothetical protein
MAAVLPAAAWSSKDILLFSPVHQDAISRVLGPLLSPADISALRDAQVAADQDQSAAHSHLHAMTGVVKAEDKPDKPRADYIRNAEAALREDLGLAIAAHRQGDGPTAMAKLGAALHILTDATSPTHRGFQPWSYDETIWQKASHVFAERLTPSDTSPAGDRARLDAAVRWGYDLYTERAPMPARFFAPDSGMLELPSVGGVR